MSILFVRSWQTTSNRLALVAVLCVGACVTTGRPAAPEVEVSTVTQAARASNGFGFDVYGRVKVDGENLVYSPVGVAVALAMALAGAQGETQAEMARVLRFSRTKLDAGHAAYGELRGFLNQRDGADGMALRVSNRLWGQSGTTFVPAFLGVMRDRYAAPLEAVDFAGAPAAALVTINAWAAQETHQRIRKILLSGSVTPATRLVLTNAVHFKGEWQAPFAESNTQDREFTTPSGKVKTKVMAAALHLGYARLGDIQLLELPYRGGLTMVVVLPDEGLALAKVESRLTEDFVRWMVAFNKISVNLQLPRWKLESTLSLNEALARAGMPRAFTRRADFTGMVATGDLSIDFVIQKGFVEVNEKGTEAAAVTAVGMKEGESSSPLPIDVHVNRPFLYFIREPLRGVVLFMGRVVDPTRPGA